MKRIFATLFLISILAACAPTTPIQTPTEPVEASPFPLSKPEAWWRDAVFYEVFVRSFNDSNGDGIGDFNGLTAKLDYIQSLGATALWLMPIHPSPSYHGYDVTNYYSVNPEYGTMDDFKRMLSEAHKRNIKVIIDLVLNHTSSQHPFFQNAISDPKSKYHDWYVWSSTSADNHWYANSNEFYYAYFCGCMPDLNYLNPDVTAQMENVVRFWLNDVGIDGFRMDAAKHLIEEGKKLENTASTHNWLKGFYTSYKADNPDSYTIGEVSGAGGFIAKTYTGDQLDQVFNFELASGFVNSASGGSNSGVNSALKLTLKDMPSGDYGSFLTNHDQNRVMSVLGNNTDKAKLAAFMLLTSPGTPFIYYGEEIGMQGKKPDEDIRLPMQWDATANAGFTTGTPWRAPTEDFATVNVAAQTSDPKSLLSFYRDLIAIRKAHSALQTGGTLLTDSGNPALFASIRTDGNESFLVIGNLKNEPVSNYSLSLAKSSLAQGSYQLTPIFGAGNFTNLTISANGQATSYQPLTEIPPYGMYILQIKLIK